MAEQTSQEWWHLRRKNTTVTGTYEENAFQVSLRESLEPEDPLRVPTYCEVFPFHCIPHCGVYGFDDYTVALPLVTIQLASKAAFERGDLFAAFPSALRNAINNKPVNGPNSLDVFITIHPCPDFKSAVEPDKRDLNLLYHPWLFRDVEFVLDSSLQDVVEMGAFAPYNVSEVEDAVSEDTDLLNAIAINRLESRIVEVHGGMFSPRNAHIRLNPQSEVHAFYSCGWSTTNRMAVVYHVFTTSEEIDAKLTESIKASSTVLELLVGMNAVSDHFAELRHPLQEVCSLLECNGRT